VGENRHDRLSTFSNWGEGIDLCAPGANILSTLPENKYGAMSGTSMATPAAAAVAALIWSANPKWTREQVVAQLYGTTDSIDHANPGFEGGMGTGRANALRAVAGRARPSYIKGVKPVYESAADDRVEVRNLSIELHGLLDASAAENPANFQIQLIEAFDQEPVADLPVDPIEPTEENVGEAELPLSFRVANRYRVGSNEVILEASKALVPGRYELVVADGSLYDPFLRELDGNRDGTPGGEVRLSFEISSGTKALSQLMAQLP
jgi:hypothetical protein